MNKDFEPAFEKMIVKEGGYTLHKVEGDRGGQTYAGIARNFHGDWSGWSIIDANDMDNPNLTAMVRDFYKQHYWDKIKGDEIKDGRVASNLFLFAVNGGYRTASKLAQKVVGTTPDGIIGTKTVAAINKYHSELFVAEFTLTVIARYRDIVMRNRSQGKFLLGWLNRVL